MMILKGVSRPQGVSETVWIRHLHRVKPLSTINVNGVDQGRETIDLSTV